MFALQYHFPRILEISRIIVRQFTANHHGDQFVLARLFHDSRADALPVTHDRDTVADLLQLTHFMGNIDDTHTLLRQRADCLKQKSDLFV